MKIFCLNVQQMLPISVDTAWDFLSHPRNLREITPPSLDFRIIGDPPTEMYEGLMIEYSVRPLPFMRARWLSEITHLQPPFYFVDEQRVGPYALWHHEHRIEKCADGVIMHDAVTYGLKQPLIDGMLNRFIVHPQILSIFEYRRTKLDELFPRQ